MGERGYRVIVVNPPTPAQAGHWWRMRQRRWQSSSARRWNERGLSPQTGSAGELKEGLMKTSKTLQLARDEHDDNTATIQMLRERTANIERLIWRAAGAGIISTNGLREIVDNVRTLRACAARVLERHRLVASLLCAVVGGLDPYSDKAKQRLPALQMLAESEEDDKAA